MKNRPVTGGPNLHATLITADYMEDSREEIVLVLQAITQIT